MAALPYIQLYVADYLADTMHLTTEEHGAYLLIIFNYWQTGKPIPKNRLARIARLSNERWSSVELSLSEFFNDTGAEWQHTRIDMDLDAVNGSLSQKSVAGKASAEARKRKKAEEAQRKSNDSSTTVEIPLQRNANETSTNKDTDTDTDTDTETEKNIAPQAADKFSDSMIAIFDHWKKIMNHPKAKLDDKRKKLIRAALKLGYSETELITAVNGCAKSPYHMAQDGRNTTVYDDIGLILRDAKHIDQFLKINSMPPAPMANQPKFDASAYINRGKASVPESNVVAFQQDNQFVIGVNS